MVFFCGNVFFSPWIYPRLVAKKEWEADTHQSNELGCFSCNATFLKRIKATIQRSIGCTSTIRRKQDFFKASLDIQAYGMCNSAEMFVWHITLKKYTPRICFMFAALLPSLPPAHRAPSCLFVVMLWSLSSSEASKILICQRICILSKRFRWRQIQDGHERKCITIVAMMVMMPMEIAWQEAHGAFHINCGWWCVFSINVRFFPGLWISIAEKAQSHKNHQNDYRRSDHGRKSSIPELLWSNENTHRWWHRWTAFFHDRSLFFFLFGRLQRPPSIHPQIYPSSNPSSRKDLYKTVWEIKQRRVLDLAADRGAYIDQSQSLKLRHWSTFKWIKTMRFFCKGWVFFGEKRKRPGFGGDIGPMWSL